jgi:hypothetical protein
VVAWVRTLPRTARVVILAALLASGAIAFLAFDPRVDLVTYPTGRLAGILGVYAALAIGAAWIGFRPIYLPPLRRGLELAWLALAAAAPIGVALLPELATDPGAASRYHAARHAAICFAVGGSIGLASVVFARLLDRGGHRALGAATLAAVAGGLGGVAALQLECPFNYPVHLLLGHATVPAGLLLIYGVAARVRR